MIEVTQEMVADAQELLRPKGSQPADDVPIGVITLFRSSFVMVGLAPDVDLDRPEVRAWIADRCQQAADSVNGLEEAAGGKPNIMLSAPETLSDLGVLLTSG